MMTNLHVWANSDCLSLHELPRRLRLQDLPSCLRLNPFYKKQGDQFEQFNNPLIHVSRSRLNNNQLIEINRRILDDQDSVHIIILTERDIRPNKRDWLPDAIFQIGANAKICGERYPRVICVDLIRPLTKANLAARRDIRQVTHQFKRTIKRLDAAKFMNVDELDDFGLTLAGEKFLMELLTQALQEMTK